MTSIFDLQDGLDIIEFDGTINRIETNKHMSQIDGATTYLTEEDMVIQFSYIELHLANHYLN